MKEYTKPEVETITFTTEDIMDVSGMEPQPTTIPQPTGPWSPFG